MGGKHLSYGKSPTERNQQMARRKGIVETKDLRCVIYTRISVDRENQSSIANQMRECEDYCRVHGMTIAGSYSDVGKSAFKLDVERPGFDDAMAVIESGNANHLVVWKLDRMTRNARGFARINDRLESCDATFGSVMEPWFDTSSPIGYALVGLMAALAQIEAENIQGRILSWHEGRRLNGDVPIGPKPYGYDRPIEGQPGWRKGGALIINPREQSIVAECAERILGGDGLRELARELTARDVPTPNGADGWNHTSIRKCLLSPTTAAMYGDGTEADSWEPLISREQWQAVNALLTDPDRLAGFDCASRVKTHLLTNLARCECGGSLNCKIRRKGRQYGCKDCGRLIAADAVEETVTDWMLANVTDARWRAMRAAGRGRDETLIETLNRDIEELFIDYHSRRGKPGEIPTAVYNRLNDEKTAELTAAIESPAIKLPDVASLRDSWEGMSITDKRMAITGAIASVTIGAHPVGVKPTPAAARKRITIKGR